ncbi:MAG: DUF3052 domain-containing protein, partial [Armatimonadota bacterium]|nr:DUF3052 domain-containing protein [Armatimonadota bacterium]
MVGYSGTPLAAKLGIKAGFEIHLAGAPDDYLKLLEPLPEGTKIAARLSRMFYFGLVLTVKEGHMTYPSRWIPTPHGETGRTA